MSWGCVQRAGVYVEGGGGVQGDSAYPPPPKIQSIGGRYTSHWNAFFFNDKIPTWLILFAFRSHLYTPMNEIFLLFYVNSSYCFMYASLIMV